MKDHPIRRLASVLRDASGVLYDQKLEACGDWRVEEQLKRAWGC